MWSLVLMPILIGIQEVLPAKVDLTMKQEIGQKTVSFVLMILLGIFLPINNILRGIVIVSSILYYVLVWIEIIGKRRGR